jgi:pimeloyl-ACP methyl ester carboxylesterase
MQLARLDGVTLEYDEVGSGEPLLLIHGGLIAADSFVPLLAESSLASRWRMIRYHRRGYVGSSSASAPFTIGQQAADARALLGHLGIARAHVAGHSYGGAIAIQLTLDAPDLVGSLALLEPALASAVEPPEEFLEAIGSASSKYQGGDRAGAVDAFLSFVLQPEYRPLLDKNLPGAFDQAVADIGTPFRVELDALFNWSFTAEDAARIRQPVLSVIGEESGPMFDEGHKLIQQWIPHAEELRVPQANHALQFMNPRAVAEGLADFLDHQHL